MIEELKSINEEDVFRNKEFNDKITSENDLFIINKEGLKFIIEKYNKDMRSYYERQWALSMLLSILSLKEYDKEYETAYNNALKFLLQKTYQWDNHGIEDVLNLDLKDIFEEENLKKKEKAIYNINSDFLSYFRSELSEYQDERFPFYDLSEKEFSLTNSWKKDKNILEMVHIYKTFDFENNSLLIYGY